MSILHKIGLGLASSILAIGGAVALTAPASAAPAPPYFYNECNSSGSDNGIRVYDVNDASQGNTLGIGDCSNAIQNPPGRDFIYVPSVRVDVNPELYFGSGSDIDSYKIGHIDFGYGGCHESSENSGSNPDDDYADTGFRYKNYTSSTC